MGWAVQRSIRWAALVAGVLIAAGVCIAPAQAAAPAQTTQGSADMSALTCANGAKPVVSAASIVTATPPSGFDPTTASDADLQKYGFPRHPKTNDKAWKEAMKHAKYKGTDTRTWTCPGTAPHGAEIPAAPPVGSSHIHAASLGSSNAVYSGNWAGNRVNIATDEATWEWFVPGGYAKQPNTCYSMVSPWVGLGSGNSYNDPIVQAGSEDHYDCNGYNVHYMWHQVYDCCGSGGSVAYVDPFSFGISDDIYVDVWVSGNTAYYYMLDKSKNQYQTYTEGYIGDTPSCSEWVIEKGSNGLTAWNGAMNTYNADWQYQGGSLDSAGSWNHDSIHMMINGNDVAHGGAWLDPGTYSAFPLYSTGT